MAKSGTTFKPGQPGGPGRPKGSPNKKTLEFQVMLEQKGFDPGNAYVELYFKQMKLYEMLMQSKTGKVLKRIPPGTISAAAEILSDASVTLNNINQFVYPKKKAIEHSGEVGVRTFADFMAAAKGHK